MIDLRSIFGIILVLLLAGCAATGSGRVLEAEDASLAAAAWLTGSWVSSGWNGKGPRTEEHWTAPSAGTMLGMNRTVAGNRTIFYEHLRIEREDDGGGLVYHASPKGRHPSAPFRLVDQSPGRLVFENPDHDYPQRIIYTRTADNALRQRIEGEENGVFKEGEWLLVRARLRTSS